MVQAREMNEKSFSILYRNMQDKTVALISAYRSNLTKNENQKRQDALKKDVKTLGLGYSEINGRWKEEQSDEIKKERTLVIYSNADKEQLKKQIVKLALKYDQDAFILVDKENGAFLVGGTGKELSDGKELRTGEESSIGKFTASKVADIYSQMGKDTFVFENMLPDTMAGAYAYRIRNLGEKMNKKEKNKQVKLDKYTKVLKAFDVATSELENKNKCMEKGEELTSGQKSLVWESAENNYTEAVLKMADAGSEISSYKKPYNRESFATVEVTTADEDEETYLVMQEDNLEELLSHILGKMVGKLNYFMADYFDEDNFYKDMFNKPENWSDLIPDAKDSDYVGKADGCVVFKLK